ncbi:DUF2971 domain-containing protein [soil metagenome]
MIISHKECLPPSNPNVAIWRYMDFPKFVDLLEQGRLYFARQDQLGDPFEGALSDASVELLRVWDEQNPVQTVTGEPSHHILARDVYRMNSLCNYISCWHMSEHESLAMWRVYSGNGIAIRSTYRRLFDCLHESSQDVLISKVVYRDRRDVSQAENFGNTMSPVVRKGMSYEYERELRAFFQRVPPAWTSGSFPYDAYKDELDKGIGIEVDLSSLIEKVYVAPGRPQWFKDLVGKVLKTYKLEIPLETSSLEERPDTY